MKEHGVIVGCDRNQEWLLPWWWEHYSAHNSYPVAFADFGLSKKALAWCRKKGICLKLPFFDIVPEANLSSSTKDRWENHYGKGIWFCRSAWFKKPLCLLHSPFSLGLWIDLDCQINGSLEPLFNSLIIGAEMALVREPDLVQKLDEQQGFLLPGEINYNAGVVVFRQNAPILHHWLEEAAKRNQEYVSDQPALCRAILAQKPHLIELPSAFNWVRALGPNPAALIYHFTGGAGKLEIMNLSKKT